MTRITLRKVRQTGALPSEINFARAVCVRNVLVDVHGAPVVNCAVVRMEGGIAEVDVLRL